MGVDAYLRGRSFLKKGVPVAQAPLSASPFSARHSMSVVGAEQTRDFIALPCSATL